MEIELFEINYSYKCFEDEEIFHKLQNTLSQSIFSPRGLFWEDPDDLEKWVNKELYPLKYVSRLDLNNNISLLQKELCVTSITINLKEDQSLNDLKECKFSSYS